MKSIEFPEVNVRIAENQPEYETLPAFHDPKEGSMTFCFELSPDELEQVGKTGCIYIKQLTFNKPMNPIAGSCLKEVLIENMRIGQKVKANISGNEEPHFIEAVIIGKNNGMIKVRELEGEEEWDLEESFIQE